MKNGLFRMLRLGLCALLTGLILLPSRAIGNGTGALEAETAEWPLLLQEDFSDGKAEAWQPTDPDAWEVFQRGDNWIYAVVRQCQYKPPVRSPWNISILREPVVTDFLLEVRLRSTTKDYPHRDMCIVFGYQDAQHFYYAHLGKQADPHSHSVFIVNATPRVSIATERTDGTPWDDEEHVVRVRRETSSGLIEVFFDDGVDPIIKATDRTFLRGRIGVGAFDDLGEIHEVRLWGVKPAGGEPHGLQDR
jgi:hypothetical protein